MAVSSSRLVYLVCATSIVAFSNLYLFHPLLPVMAEYYQQSELAANMIMASAMGGMGIGLIVFAGLADAIGRRAIFLWTILLGTLVTILIPSMGDFNWIIVARFTQGFLLSGCPAVAIAFLSDELPTKRIPSAIGLFVAANSLGGLSGRLSAAFITQYFAKWQMACWFLGGLGMLLAGVAVIFMPKAQGFTAKSFSIKQMGKDFAHHLINRRLLVIYLIAGIVFGVFMNQFSFLLFTLTKPPYSLPTALSGLIFCCYLAGTFAAIRSGKFSQRFGLVRGVQVGLIMMAFSCILLMLHALGFILLGLCGLTAGFFFCHSQASSLVGKQVTQAKASAQALYTLFYYAGASVGAFYLQPFYAYWGWDGIVLAVFIGVACCGVLTLTLSHARSHGTLTDEVMPR